MTASIIVYTENPLDARAGEVFDGFHLTRRDDKHSTAEEERFNTVDAFGEQVVIVTWTTRGAARRIITMWKTDDKEKQAYERARGRGR